MEALDVALEFAEKESARSTQEPKLS